MSHLFITFHPGATNLTLQRASKYDVISTLFNVTGPFYCVASENGNGTQNLRQRKPSNFLLNHTVVNVVCIQTIIPVNATLV